MLKSLELSGFKSFAKKTEIQFKTKVTGIVGPNGSGKSNVAEAFRFVLGEQSIKSMRGKRGEDLIWNGSSEAPRSNRAHVKLTFDNKQKKLDLDFDEVTIERIVNRDGTNEYLINGSEVRLKDVLELLSQAHIGTSSHHIISQGEADKILRATIKERREMIEDALGLKLYQYKREESQRKLVKTEENIKQVESLRREIAPHIRFLKKQVEKIEKAEEVRNALSSLYREYLKREYVYLVEQKKKLEIARKPIDAERERLESEMQTAKGILNQSVGKDAKSDELLSIETNIKQARELKESLQKQNAMLDGEIQAYERHIEGLVRDHAIEENRTVLLKDIEALRQEVSVLGTVEEILQKINEFIERNRHVLDESKIRELRLKVEEINNSRQSLLSQIQEAENTLKAHEETYVYLKNQIEKDKDVNREAEKNIFRIRSEQAVFESEYKNLLEQERFLQREEEEWKREREEGAVLLGSLIIGFESTEISSEDKSREEQYTRKRELEKMKIRLEELGGAGGSEIMKEYKDSLDRDAYLEKELNDLYKSGESLKVLMRELLIKLDTEFKSGIEGINKSFQSFFSVMFGGGEARLDVVKSLKPKNKNPEDDDIISEEEKEEDFNDGIDIYVSLPRKKLKGLDMLSGGERALTSIALLFAISSVNPPPFIILDETDAALDEANSKKYGDSIEKLSELSQLILITHNRETMSRAGVIYGVTMGRDSVSRTLSIEFEEAVAVAK